MRPAPSIRIASARCNRSHACATFTYWATEYAKATAMIARSSRPNSGIRTGMNARLAITPYTVLRNGVRVSRAAKNGARSARWMPEPGTESA